MSEEERAAAEARGFEMYKQYLEHRNSLATSHMQAVISFATLAIRGAFLLNGAVVVAVLAKEGGDPELARAIIKSCAWGSILAVACAGASYVAQRFYMAADVYKADKWMNDVWKRGYPPPRWHEKGCCGNTMAVVSAIFFALSLGCAGCAAWGYIRAIG